MKVRNLYRKISFRFLKLLSMAISSALGLFCTFCGTLYGPEPAPLYGMPNADYKISGTVSSAEQNLPVKGLSISITDTLNPSNIIISSQTDTLGKFSLQFFGTPFQNTWNLQVRDIDSTENGSFSAKDTIISIHESDLKEPSGTWYKGHAEKVIYLKVSSTPRNSEFRSQNQE